MRGCAKWVGAALLPLAAAAGAGEPLRLGDGGYLTAPGVDVIVFDDIYPDGHQTGVTVIQEGARVAANGDLRLEPEPGQWSPMPAAVGKHVVDPATGTRLSLRRRRPIRGSCRLLRDLVIRVGALVDVELRSGAADIGLVKIVTIDKARQLLDFQPRPAAEAIVAAATSMIAAGLITR